jgi:hypothetical protein
MRAAFCGAMAPDLNHRSHCNAQPANTGPRVDPDCDLAPTAWGGGGGGSGGDIVVVPAPALTTGSSVPAGRDGHRFLGAPVPMPR